MADEEAPTPVEVPPEAPAPAAVEEALPPPPAVRDPNKPILCRHWSRPKTSDYSLLYDYRRNYYDDVIDYLDKRQRGLITEIPRPQTWAERALRTSVSKGRLAKDIERQRDRDLLASIRTSNKFFTHHSNAYIHRKYAKYLY